MNIREISKPVTAKSLNESLAKRFGQKINIDAFTLEQLQDARNRIRTKLSQVEMNENFDSVTKNEGYQKSKLFLDVLNAAIKERADVEEKMDPVGQEDDDINNDGKTNSSDEYLRKRRAAIAKNSKKKVDELGVTNRQTGQTTTLPSGNVQDDSIEDLLQQAQELALQSGDPNGQQRAREISVYYVIARHYDLIDFKEC